MSLNKLYQINSLGIREISLGEIRVEKLADRVTPKVPFPHKHDFFQLILVTSGTGSHEIDFTKHKIAEGKVFFMKPAQVHSWTLSKNIQGIVIEFSRESMEQDLTVSIDSLPDVFTLRKGIEYRRMLNLAEMMLEEFSKNKIQTDLTKKILSAFLIYLNNKNPAQTASKNLNSAELLKKLIETNFKKEHAVDFYAKEMKMTAKNLTMTITRAIGVSPRSLIQDRVLLEAKRLLGYSQMSIAEIGYKLGFEDPNYFSRFVKTHLNQTAAEFRNDFRKK